MNVAKTAGRFIQEVFGIAVTIHTARDAHVVPIHGQLLCAIGESDRDLCEPDRRPRLAAVENNVGHLVAAERLGRLFPQHPTDGIEHIGFAAAVRPNNGRDAFVKIENGLIGKRLEAE